MIPAQEQRDFIEKVPDDVLIVLDEAYYEYAIGGDYPESIELLDEFPNLLVLRTFSKAYGLAAELGMQYNRDIIEYLNRVRVPLIQIQQLKWLLWLP